jgi:hypothetical protein
MKLSYFKIFSPNLTKLFACSCVFIALAMASLMHAQDLSKLPAPVFPFEATGVRRASLEKIQELLRENKIWDFYKAADKIIAEIEDKKEEHHDSIFAEDDLVALEWLFYIVTPAPLIPDEEYLEKTNYNEGAEWDEIRVKKRILYHIERSTIKEEIIQKRLILAYRRTTGKEPNVEFLAKAARENNINHLIYFTAMTKFFFETHEAALKKYHSIQYVPTPGFVSKSVPLPDFRPEMSSAEKQRLHKEFLRADRASEDPAGDRFVAAKSRQTQKGMSDVHQDTYQKEFVWRVVSTFPQDAAMVQKYIKLAGYSSDEKCAKVIAILFPKTAETAYLYEGLSLPEKKEKQR